MRLNRLGGTELPGHTQALLSESSVGKQKKAGDKVVDGRSLEELCEGIL